MAQPVDFEIIKPIKRFLHPQTFLKRLEQVNSVEYTYCSQLIRQAAKNQTRLHLLVTTETLKIVGLIALSTANILKGGDAPCIVIDYLLTAQPYRGQFYNQLDNRKISEYLVDYALKTAAQINNDVPVRYVTLLPAHEKLIPLYNSLKFIPLDKSGWLFFKVAQ